MKSKFGIALLWILVFLLGGVSGAVCHYLYREHLRAFKPGASFKPPDIVDGMARVLKMDAPQKESLKAIFSESRQRYQALNQEFRPQYEALNQQYRPQYEALNKQFRPRFDAIRKETEEKIKGILRTDQRAKYEAFLKKVYAAPPGPPRPPSPK
jgi:hypothetical protein